VRRILSNYFDLLLHRAIVRANAKCLPAHHISTPSSISLGDMKGSLNNFFGAAYLSDTP